MYELAYVLQKACPVPAIIDSSITYSPGAGIHGPACHVG
jgi:hypothetical protein